MIEKEEPFYRIKLVTPEKKGAKVDYDMSGELDREDFDPHENVDEVVNLLVYKGLVTEEEIENFILKQMNDYTKQVEVQRETRRHLIDDNRNHVVFWASEKYQKERIKIIAIITLLFSTALSVFFLITGTTLLLTDHPFVVKELLKPELLFLLLIITAISSFLIALLVPRLTYLNILSIVEKGATDDDVIWYLENVANAVKTAEATGMEAG